MWHLLLLTSRLAIESKALEARPLRCREVCVLKAREGAACLLTYT